MFLYEQMNKCLRTCLQLKNLGQRKALEYSHIRQLISCFEKRCYFFCQDEYSLVTSCSSS